VLPNPAAYEVDILHKTSHEVTQDEVCETSEARWHLSLHLATSFALTELRFLQQPFRHTCFLAPLLLKS